MTTVAAVIIGDEILSGKIDDTNTGHLIRMLRSVGAQLQRIVVIGDELDTIAAEVRSASQRYDVVITSGGLGPTHDDCTVAAVARAFDVDVERVPELEALIRRLWSGRLTEAALRLADAPAGSRVIDGSDRWLPVVAFQNVYLLPGVPQIFEAKLETLRAELAGEPVSVCTLFVDAFESDVADEIARVAGEQPRVKIGSYPRMGDPDHRLRITVEGDDMEALERAVARLHELLPERSVLRTER